MVESYSPLLNIVELTPKKLNVNPNKIKRNTEKFSDTFFSIVTLHVEFYDVIERIVVAADFTYISVTLGNLSKITSMGSFSNHFLSVILFNKTYAAL